MYERNGNEGAKQITDALVSLRNGSDEAFAFIAESYDNLLRSQATLFLSKCKDLGAEYDDLIQEASMALYKAAVTYDLEKKDITFGLYAKVCVHNRLVSVQRKLIRANIRKTAKTKLTKGENKYPYRVGRIVGSDEYIGILSRFERDVFTLYLEGCSYCEIAERLRKEVKSIDNAMYRIRRKLKNIMG